MRGLRAKRREETVRGKETEGADDVVEKREGVGKPDGGPVAYAGVEVAEAVGEAVRPALPETQVKRRTRSSRGLDGIGVHQRLSNRATNAVNLGVVFNEYLGGMRERRVEERGRKLQADAEHAGDAGLAGVGEHAGPVEAIRGLGQ